MLTTREKNYRIKLRKQIVDLAVQVRQLQSDNALKDRQLQEANKRLEVADVKLTEARRRTIPMADGSEINFLPLGLVSVDIQHDIARMASIGGKEIIYGRGPARATIIADGTTIQYHMVKKG